MFQSVRRMICMLPIICSLAQAAGAEVPPPGSDDLPQAIAELKACVAGLKELAGPQIDAHTKTIRKNASQIRSDRSLLSECMELVSTYDREMGPLFVAYRGLNNRERKPGDEIHWAIFWAMQAIFDQAYNAEGLERFGDLLDGFRFGSADYFPGKVDASPELIETNYTVNVMGSYPNTWGAPIIGEALPARKPTGAYLVPGAIATVAVPEALIGKGYRVRVGAHSWDLSRKKRITRLFRVSTTFDITQRETRVANPLGGGIYIEVPYLADAGVVAVDIRNAVRSPFFSWQSFHRTSLAEWCDTERKYKAPWADFQSDKFMMQVPTSWIYGMEDPISLMQDWDAAMDTMNDLMGLPRLHGRETLYAQVDTQLRGSAFHPGYPSVNRGYDPTYDFGGTNAHHLVSGPRNAHSYEFHEAGHGFLFTKYTGDRESAVNLLHVAVFNRAFGRDLEEAFRSSRGKTNVYATLDTTAVTWMMTDSFLHQSGMKNYERAYQLKGHAKYVDIVRLFGWQILDDFWHSIQQDYENGNPWPRNVSDTDRYTLRLSEQAGVDLRPLIHFWGIPTQDDDASDTATAAAGLGPSADVYDLLVRYKGLVPANRAAFREHALKWWERKPSKKGFTTERNHASRWESYDEDMAEATRQAVQNILDRYFPHGRPTGKSSK